VIVGVGVCMIARALPSLLFVTDRREELLVGEPIVVVRPGRKAVRVEGPLSPYALGFGAHLIDRGYAPWSAEAQLRLMAHLSRWLAEQDLEPGALGGEIAECFLRSRRERYSYLTGKRAPERLLIYLRDLGVMPQPVGVDTLVERLLAEYRAYLVRERGLVAGSVRLREHVARLFLAERPQPLELSLQRLEAGDVTAFVVAQCGARRRGVAWSRTLTSGLRSLLRYLHLAGWVPVPLAQAVPSVAGWRLASLPRALEPEQVQRLVESCDRSTALGSGDLAILMLLSRLGLRAGEVAALRLDDIDWRAGELTVRGRGARTERLPLPHDVGEALVSYLRAGRGRASFREVFLRAIAPHGPLSPGGVCWVVHAACDRAGMARVGAHRLRHTVATEMLRAGAGLEQIAQVLRHSSVTTTAVYAKVDRTALRRLARPWPSAAGAS
jgi:site-specific recombinase XerD